VLSALSKIQMSFQIAKFSAPRSSTEPFAEVKGSLHCEMKVVTP
jgi:hypothetical protein